MHNWICHIKNYDYDLSIIECNSNDIIIFDIQYRVKFTK